jgi:hypothetical protein
MTERYGIQLDRVVPVGNITLTNIDINIPEDIITQILEKNKAE